MNHTKVPWRVAEQALDSDGEVHKFVIHGDYSRAAIAMTLDFCPNNPGMREANARRIVDCVNACDGIPSELLKPGAVLEAVQLAAESLNACADQFERYAASHLAKGDTEKADINAAFAKMARGAISK